MLERYFTETPIKADEMPEAVEVPVEADLSKHGLPTLRGVLDLVRAGGRINIFAGAADGPDLAVDFLDLYHRELAIFSTYSSSPATLADAFALLASGRVRVEPLISHRLPLSAFDEGVRLQRGGQATKVVFHP